MKELEGKEAWSVMNMLLRSILFCGVSLIALIYGVSVCESLLPRHELH